LLLRVVLHFESQNPPNHFAANAMPQDSVRSRWPRKRL
jgi:hypothetical protein